MPITLTFHLGVITISIRIFKAKSDNRHSAK